MEIGKYLLVEELGQPPERKTKRWQVSSKSGSILGIITWHGPWRQYVFMPDPNCIFNTGCMEDLCTFIKEQMESRRKT